MQDEVNKHTRKIYNAVKNQNYSLVEKVREVLIEIFIIVFAVTLSIWLHSWSEHRHEQAEARKFLVELKEDLTRDIKLLEDSRRTSMKLDSNYKFVLALKKNQMDDTLLGSYTDMISFSANFNTGRYEGFKSSGKISTIENDKLKNNILSYYQQTIPNLISDANFINTEQMKIISAGQNESGNLSLNEFLTTRKIHSMYYFLEYNFRTATISFEKTINQANEIIAEIDKEIKE